MLAARRNPFVARSLWHSAIGGVLREHTDCVSVSHVHFSCNRIPFDAAEMNERRSGSSVKWIRFFLHLNRTFDPLYTFQFDNKRFRNADTGTHTHTCAHACATADVPISKWLSNESPIFLSLFALDETFTSRLTTVFCAFRSGAVSVENVCVAQDVIMCPFRSFWHARKPKKYVWNINPCNSVELTVCRSCIKQLLIARKRVHSNHGHANSRSDSGEENKLSSSFVICDFVGCVNFSSKLFTRNAADYGHTHTHTTRRWFETNCLRSFCNEEYAAHAFGTIWWITGHWLHTFDLNANAKSEKCKLSHLHRIEDTRPRSLNHRLLPTFRVLPFKRFGHCGR